MPTTVGMDVQCITIFFMNKRRDKHEYRKVMV